MITKKQSKAYNKKYYLSNRERIRKQGNAYAALHREEANNRAKNHYQENKEQKVAYQKEYRENNKKTINFKLKVYREANKEKIKEQRSGYVIAHREEARIRSAKWYKENPERAKASGAIARHKRRARIAKVGGSFTKADIRNMYATQGACCYYCSVSIEEKYEIEHMIPISKGGSNWIDNICLACVPCNHTKGVRTAEEFMNG